MSKSIKPKPGKVSLSYLVSEILQKNAVETQDELCKLLVHQGVETNQAAVSRVLNKLGAVKMNEGGKSVYRLPPELMIMTPKYSLNQLVLSVSNNEILIVMHTAPGAAQLVARFLDQQKSIGIMGTVAGDDTVVVIPEMGVKSGTLKENILSLLAGWGKPI